MSKQHNNHDGFKIQLNSALLYCLLAALVGFIIRVESTQSITGNRIAQLERRTDTLEADLKSIKESLYEIKGDVKLLIKESMK